MEIFNVVKNKVDLMRGTEIEKKVKEATSHENWGAPSTLKHEIARATFSYEGYREVMPLLWRRMGEDGKNWRIVYKCLELLDFLLRHGSERVIREARDRIYTIRTLHDFRYVDEQSIDRGSGVREKSKKVVDILNNSDRLKEIRDIAKRNAGKYKGYANDGSMGGGGGGGGRYDDYDDYNSWDSRGGSQRGRKKEKNPWGDINDVMKDDESSAKKDKKKKKKKHKHKSHKKHVSDSDESESEPESDDSDKKKKKKKKKSKSKEDKKEKKKKKKIRMEVKPAKKSASRKKAPKLASPDANEPDFGDFDEDPFQAVASGPAAPSDDDELDFNPRGDEEPDFGDDTFAAFESAPAEPEDEWGGFDEPQTQAAPQVVAQPVAAPPSGGGGGGGGFFDVFEAPVANDLVGDPVDVFVPQKKEDPVAAVAATPATNGSAASNSSQTQAQPSKPQDALWGSNLIDLDKLSLEDQKAKAPVRATTTGATSSTRPLPNLGPSRQARPAGGDAFSGLMGSVSSAPAPVMPMGRGQMYNPYGGYPPQQPYGMMPPQQQPYGQPPMMMGGGMGYPPQQQQQQQRQQQPNMGFPF